MAAILAGLMLLPAANADDDDRWERRRDRRGYGYGSSRDYGRYGDTGVLDRTLSDLRRAASRNRVDSHERGHFNRAINELQAMRYRGYDERRLDRVIDDLEDLSRAHQVHPRDRQILAQDMYQLRRLRNGGYYRGAKTPISGTPASTSPYSIAGDGNVLHKMWC